MFKIHNENEDGKGGAILEVVASDYDDGAPNEVVLDLISYDDISELDGPEDDIDKIGIGLTPDQADQLAIELKAAAAKVRENPVSQVTSEPGPAEEEVPL
jgi:hypothetical protein